MDNHTIEKQSRSILAILSTDITGYTQKTETDENLLVELKKHPYHPKTHYELSLLYHEMEAIEKATNHLQLAVKIWKNADEDYSNAREAKSLLNDWQ